MVPRKISKLSFKRFFLILDTDRRTKIILLKNLEIRERREILSNILDATDRDMKKSTKDLKIIARIHSSTSWISSQIAIEKDREIQFRRMENNRGCSIACEQARGSGSYSSWSH